MPTEPGGPFPETSWSLILQCKAGAGDEAFRERLEVLFGRYWPPVFLHVRRYWSRDDEEAKDLVQAFFLAFLEKDFLDAFDAERGRFRTFVCAALRNFVLTHRKAMRARKRQPEAGLLSIDAMRDDCSGFDVQDTSGQTPEEHLERTWRKAVIARAVERLREQAAERGRDRIVDLFVASDLDDSGLGRMTYRELAEFFGLTVSQVTNGLHWARKRFMDLVLSEIRDQTAGEDDYRSEARDLFGIDV